jgi:hypothetical protein
VARRGGVQHPRERVLVVGAALEEHAVAGADPEVKAAMPVAVAMDLVARLDAEVVALGVVDVQELAQARFDLRG